MLTTAERDLIQAANMAMDRLDRATASAEIAKARADLERIRSKLEKARDTAHTAEFPDSEKKSADPDIRFAKLPIGSGPLADPPGQFHALAEELGLGTKATSDRWSSVSALPHLKSSRSRPSFCPCRELGLR